MHVLHAPATSRGCSSSSSRPAGPQPNSARSISSFRHTSSSSCQQWRHETLIARAVELDLAELERQFPDSSSSGKKGKPKKPAKSKPASKGSSKTGSAAASMEESSGAAAAAKKRNGSSNGAGSAGATVSVDKTYEEPDPVPAGVVVGDDDEAAEGPMRAGSSGISSGLRLENVSITFKNQQVLKDCTWEVKKGERVGLVGVNGAGKTTQLQIVMGRLTPDAGEVIKAKRNMKVAYLAQEFDVEPSRTVREEFSSVYRQQLKVVSERERISKELEGVGEDMDRMQCANQGVGRAWAGCAAGPPGAAQRAGLDMDVQLLDKKIDQMMPELGFMPQDNDRLVSSYSGGWQMRMCLGKLLLQEPDVLLLDEPTNHLDLDAIEWLEGYLKQQEVPMVIVSHDREFLDNLCTKVVETERGVATTYKGNYTAYVAAKAEREALQWAAYERQQKEIDKLQDLVRRLAGGAQSGRAAAAEKQLERMKAEGLIEKPFVPKRRSFTFPPVEKMGTNVVEIKGLSHGYDGRLLFKDVDLEIGQGERIAIIGPNGAGKSTLLRLIMGREKALRGTVRLGEHNIVPNYFEQNQAEALDLSTSVLDTLVRSAPDAKINDLKQLLGRMLFSGNAMEKKVKVLSGGEKARLALAKFMCTQGTLLVLDEPTNHLDIPSKETLEEAIRCFEGAVIAVSHDRYFLKRIATRVLLAEDRQLKDFQGDYEYYLSKNDTEAEKMAVKAAKVKAVEQSAIKAKSKMSKAERERQKKDKAKAFNDAAAGKSKRR
ncbi:P-loop containing nucleoside triphosphate hydrolase protein [Scenedesmus sp. NREL 46B-D3]|nr:P-loop containing nucleoside triphosphate hydrolase protein [Scenedesmus sp. NREL 46B-D3]